MKLMVQMMRMYRLLKSILKLLVLRSIVAEVRKRRLPRRNTLRRRKIWRVQATTPGLKSSLICGMSWTLPSKSALLMFMPVATTATPCRLMMPSPLINCTHGVWATAMSLATETRRINTHHTKYTLRCLRSSQWLTWAWALNTQSSLLQMIKTASNCLSSSRKY